MRSRAVIVVLSVVAMAWVGCKKTDEPAVVVADKKPVPSPPAADEPATPGPELPANAPQACKDYFAVMDALVKCDKTPEAKRKAIVNAVKEMKGTIGKELEQQGSAAIERWTAGCPTMLDAATRDATDSGC